MQQHRELHYLACLLLTVRSLPPPFRKEKGEFHYLLSIDSICDFRLIPVIRFRADSIIYRFPSQIVNIQCNIQISLPAHGLRWFLERVATLVWSCPSPCAVAAGLAPKHLLLLIAFCFFCILENGTILSDKRCCRKRQGCSTQHGDHRGCEIFFRVEAIGAWVGARRVALTNTDT